MSRLSLSCQCGQVKGNLSDISSKTGTRIICYCNDCQAFANQLGRNETSLNEFGGTDIYQATPSQIEITEGTANLRSVRIKPKGLYRWYAGCCNTPIANTISGKHPFVGLFVETLGADDTENRDAVLGPVQHHIMGKYALGSPQPVPHPKFPVGLVAKIMTRMVIGKIKHLDKPNAFFDDSGKAISAPAPINQNEQI